MNALDRTPACSVLVSAKKLFLNLNVIINCKLKKNASFQLPCVVEGLCFESNVANLCLKYLALYSFELLIPKTFRHVHSCVHAVNIHHLLCVCEFGLTQFQSHRHPLLLVLVAT